MAKAAHAVVQEEATVWEDLVPVVGQKQMRMHEVQGFGIQPMNALFWEGLGIEEEGS
jgi:hypothetical protein